MTNFWRQMSVFDPTSFDKDIHIVGCGAIGSHTVETLVNTGFRNITVYDFDDVEEHNLPNQVFRIQDIGKKKVEAMQQIASEFGANIAIVPDKVQELELQSKEAYIIMAVDSMQSRKDIFEANAKYNPLVRFLETRMAAEYGFIHAINPIIDEQIEFWEQSWFPDSEAEENACTNRAIATTAKFLSSILVHYLIRWEAGEDLPLHTMACLRPPMIQTRNE